MMVKVRDITGIMEKHFPLNLAETWDNCGLQLGSMNARAHRVIICLDLDEEALIRAQQEKADLIITHHPLFFKGINRISFDTWQGRIIKQLIDSNINVYSAHTNLDSGEKGLNQILAELMGLKNIKPLPGGKRERLYKIAVFVPVPYIGEVRNAMNTAGGGSIGKYSDCSFRMKGTGTFRPGEDTNPFIGSTGVFEEVEEFRLEIVVPESKLNKVINAMNAVHPYEEVAFDIYELSNEYKTYSPGRLGDLAEMLSLQQCALYVKKCLDLQNVKVVGDLKEKVKKMALVSGAGASFVNTAIACHADVLLTGDVKYHEAQEALQKKIAIIDAGHQGTERIVSSMLMNLLERECYNRGWNVEFIPFNSSALFNEL